MMKKDRQLDPQQINLYAYVRNNPLKFIDTNGEDIFLANNTSNSRRKALLSITGSLKTTEEKRNLGYRKNEDGKYELYVKDPSKIKNGSAQYNVLVNRINQSTEIDFTLIEKGKTAKGADGAEYSQAGLAANAGGVTIGYDDGSVEVFVAEGGVTNGVKGLTESGKDVQIEFSESLVTAHELLGETAKFTGTKIGNSLLNDPIKDSKVVIALENMFRKELKLPLRSGKDHGYIQPEVVNVH